MVRLMDCTLRDGANVVGKGFDAEITTAVSWKIRDRYVFKRKEIPRTEC